MQKHLKQFLNDESGQGVPEYGLILGAVVVVGLAVITIFGNAIVDLFTDVAGRIEGADVGSALTASGD